MFGWFAAATHAPRPGPYLARRGALRHQPRGCILCKANQWATARKGGTLMHDRWTYIGELPGKDTKIVAVWRTGTGERVAWKASPQTRGVPGMVYDVTGFDGNAWPGVAWTGAQADDAASIQLEARSRESARRTEAAIAKAKRTPAHQDLLARVAEYSKGLTWEARQHLADELAKATFRA